MAKREMSSTLKSLKFMQRAVAQKDETTKKEEEVKPDGNFFAASRVNKCVVIVEGDPHPGAIKGRMSFLSFNPSIDKLNKEAADTYSDASGTGSGNQSKKSSLRENESSANASGPSSADTSNGEANGDCKRKISESVSGTQYPNKSPKFSEDDHQSSHQISKSSRKQLKRENLDWRVLRQSKSQNKRE